VIVAMNKMDATLPTPWSCDRFSFIEQSMRQLLCCELLFDEHLVRCIPISGLTGQNLTSRDMDESSALLTQWYRGPTLLEAMDSFLIPACRSQPMSFRAVINDVLSVDKNRGRYEVGITVLQGAVSTKRTIACYTNSTAENPSTDGPQTMVVTGITQKKNSDQGDPTIMMSVADGGNSMQTRLRTGEPGLLQLSSP
jgi:translation elongation factor EF-1alpha